MGKITDIPQMFGKRPVLFLCKMLCLMTLIQIAESCKRSVAPRYISEEDTTYSADIRSISGKINKDPENPELYYRRSNAFYFEDNFKQALADIELALKLDSVNPLYHLNRAKYLMSGDTAQSRDAEKSYLNAIRLKPDFFDAYTGIAKLMLAKQKYEKAEYYYTEANKIEPANPLPYFYLGIAAKEMGDTAKAMALFEKTLVYDSKNYNAIMQLGNFYALTGDKKALLFFDRALALNEFSDEALYAKGLFLQKKNRFKDAVLLYETVSRINPGHIFCRYNLGLIHAMFENYKEAIRYLDETIDLAPEYADAYTLRGTVKEKMKNSTGAYNDYKRAVQLDDNQVKAKEGLKRINITISMP